MPHVEVLVYPSNIDEQLIINEPPIDRVRRLAVEKCYAIQIGLPIALRAVPVIGSDTEIVLNGVALGKPCSDADARSMLSQLSGSTHEAITGVCISLGQSPTKQKIRVARTEVVFRSITKTEIDHYIATREPLGKAGGYAIQGIGAAFVDRINGSYSNVVGLPLEALDCPQVTLTK
jgi:septum formation protein